MPKPSERGVAHILFLLLLVVGLIVGVYLITSGAPFNFLPKASLSKPTGPEVSFSLVGPSGCTAGILCAIYGQHALREEFEVKLYARSDIETANLFTAKMTFPKDLVEVKEIREEKSFGPNTINWVEDFYDNNTGEISLTGGVPAPGYQTQVNGPAGLMATITFRAKALGKGTVSFTDSSEILSNLNNINILTVKRGYDFTIEVKPSPTPVSGSSYYIEKLPIGGVYMVAPSEAGSGYAVYALLRDGQGNVVANQSNLNYSWQVEQFGGGSTINVEPFAGCANGTQPPCPLDHANITVPSVGSTTSANLWVTVSDKTTNQILTKAEFVLNFVPKSEYVSFNTVKPGYSQGETYNVGQKVPISWNLVGTNVDYYNLGYFYYQDGANKSGYIGTVKYPISSYDWTIPAEIANQQVRISIEPRGKVVTNPGWGYSDWSFKVGSSKVCLPRPACLDAKPACKLPESAEGWCPNPTPVPGPKGNGDGNKDGKINLIDMSILHTDWKADLKINKTIREGIDMNNDGLVNVFDFSALRNLLAKLGVIKIR